MAINPDITLPLVENMLFKLAWKAAQQYPITFEEARSEVYFAFVRACDDYQEDRGTKFSTWCYFWAWTHLKNVVTKQAKSPLVYVEINEDLCGEAPPESADVIGRIRDLVADLSEDARLMIDLIVETPTELLEGKPTLTPHQLFTRVKNFLLRSGRDRGQVEQACEEIRLRLQEAW